jgi:hypothetical protein
VTIRGRFIKLARTKRRMTAFLVAAAMAGLPAGALRVMCLGEACEVRADALANTPFCSLPEKIRRLIERGSYEGRSPDIVAVSGRTLISGGDSFAGDDSPPLWPSITRPDDGRVPVVFAGTGVEPGARVPSGTGLEDVSETIAAMIELRRPHPDVRSGEAVDGVASGAVPRLVLEVVWKGLDSDELERDPAAWPQLKRLMRQGSGTVNAVVGSLPLDPAATLATIGTGGFPSRHGVTGTVLRENRSGYVSTDIVDGGAGMVVRAWTKETPTSVIATLGDHLDKRRRQKPVIGLVGTDSVDRGLIGGTWYVEGDRDPVEILDRGSSVEEQMEAARSLLVDEDFGRDGITDLAGVVMSGPVVELDSALVRLVQTARDVSRGSVAVVVTTTGGSDLDESETVVDARTLRSRLERTIAAPYPVIEALGPGGLYLDQRALARLKLSDDIVLRELLRMRDRNGDQLVADAFPTIAVTFGRYC